MAIISKIKANYTGISILFHVED